MIEHDKIPIWVSRDQKAKLPYLCLKNLTEEFIEELGVNPLVPPQGGSKPGFFQPENLGPPRRGPANFVGNRLPAGAPGDFFYCE